MKTQLVIFVSGVGDIKYYEFVKKGPISRKAVTSYFGVTLTNIGQIFSNWSILFTNEFPKHVFTHKARGYQDMTINKVNLDEFEDNLAEQMDSGFGQFGQ